MEKKKADFIIEQYLKPIYGFALNKTSNSEKAEELASRIVLQVYSVLLKREDIIDVNAYIFKVAHNVWVSFLKDGTVEQNNICLEDVQLGDDFSVDKEILKSEEYRLLRREIAYLSKQRRSIVMSYYYGNKKISEIAETLNMSAGTIKWHLFECKKELKKGMESIRNIGNLGLNPIKLNNMGHSGKPGQKGDTKDFLAKSLTQNIAYACYFEAHTINEIADELGVSPIFIADEVDTLTEYGFMDILPSGKYRTNIILTGHPENIKNQIEDIYEQYSEALFEAYFKKLLDHQKDIEALPIYYTDHDYNFLLWSLIIYSAQRLNFSELDIVKLDEIAVMRPDGGHYIAHANIEAPQKTNIWENLYGWRSFCGYMNRVDGNIKGLKIAVYWSGESLDWRTNETSDYKLLYHFLNGNLPQDERNIDSYELLINKGYLIKENDHYKANIVYIPDNNTKAALDHLLPKLSPEIFEIAKALDDKIYRKSILGQPEHVHRAIKFSCQNCINRMHVFVMKYMLDQGILKLPTDEMRKQICNLLFHNV